MPMVYISPKEMVWLKLFSHPTKKNRCRAMLNVQRCVQPKGHLNNISTAHISMDAAGNITQMWKKGEK